MNSLQIPYEGTHPVAASEVLEGGGTILAIALKLYRFAPAITRKTLLETNPLQSISYILKEEWIGWISTT
jgi:hypothetical protein